jgi:NAD(P)-dependent dehydrogenase (short-subunit alcohol dehydrogenase family)
VTGANRGIGRSLVEDALRRGAKRVYAGTRQPWAHRDGRVTRLAMDVTNARQIQEAVAQVESLDVLINNAGDYSLYGCSSGTSMSISSGRTT